MNTLPIIITCLAFVFARDVDHPADDTHLPTDTIVSSDINIKQEKKPNDPQGSNISSLVKELEALSKQLQKKEECDYAHAVEKDIQLISKKSESKSLEKPLEEKKKLMGTVPPPQIQANNKKIEQKHSSNHLKAIEEGMTLRKADDQPSEKKKQNGNPLASLLESQMEARRIIIEKGGDVSGDEPDDWD